MKRSLTEQSNNQRIGDPLPDRLTQDGKAGEEKRSLVLPSRSFHKAGYLVDTHPKGHWQWITGKLRASQRVQVRG